VYRLERTATPAENRTIKDKSGQARGMADDDASISNRMGLGAANLVGVIVIQILLIWMNC